jgi:hypothetical protein
MLMYRLLQGRAGDLRFAPALIPGCYPCVPLAPAGRTGAVSQPVAICENVRSDGMWITRGPVSFSPVADYDALRDRHGEESTVEDRFEAVVGAGTLMSGSAASVSFPHRWTPEGVTVDADFTGGHLLHLAAAGCVLNDLYREAAALGIGLRGARVTAGGGFNPATWQSTGISYCVEVSTDASAAQLAQLFEAVDQVAEIPRAIRAGATVQRIS